MRFEARTKKFHEKRQAHLRMGGEKKLAARKAAGVLNVRERGDYLLDKGTFQEIGLFSHSDQPSSRCPRGRSCPRSPRRT